jgi:hypothetical protein
MSAKTTGHPSTPGSERDADARRPGGPRYHGDDWRRADADEAGGRIEEEGPRADDPVRVDPGQVPGAKQPPASPDRPVQRQR